jgi:hypothetical protein
MTRGKPTLPIVALLFLMLLLGLRNYPAGWWVAMSGLLAAAAWTVYEARQSWLARKSGGEVFRWRCTLDLVRFIFGLICALGLIAIGIMHRIESTPPHFVRADPQASVRVGKSNLTVARGYSHLKPMPNSRARSQSCRARSTVGATA